MRYHFFLHYGWFLQNFEKDFIPTLLHMTVAKDRVDNNEFKKYLTYVINDKIE